MQAKGAPPTEPIDDTAATVPNPHWTPQGCGHCHSVNGQTTLPIKATEVDRVCLKCHDGTRAVKEAHPIGRTFDGDQVRRPVGWPTADGKLTCLTCHAVLRGCREDARRPSHNAIFLRGDPQAGRSAFCTTCHVEPLHTRTNPHIMRTAEGAVREESCLRCHDSGILDQSPEQRIGTARLRGDEITLCGACHANHMDFFTPGHIGAFVNPDILANMMAADVSRGFQPARSSSVHGPPRRPNEQGKPRVLPLSPKGRIVCSTCHNPHQQGVFPPESVLSIGAMQEPGEAAGSIPLRIAGKELCVACHRK